MKVTKLGHCCLLIEVNGVRILTDPGNFTDDYGLATGIDIVLVTHEHTDHLHVPSLEQVLSMSPEATVFANTSVGALLAEAGIAFTLLEGEAKTECCGVGLMAHDAKHEEIYEELGQVQNTGYFIADRLFYPGDAFAVPSYGVEILALPVSGPWCKIADAVRYALTVKPKKAIPVHDGMLKTEHLNLAHGTPNKILNESGVEFIPLAPGQSAEF